MVGLEGIPQCLKRCSRVLADSGAVILNQLIEQCCSDARLTCWVILDGQQMVAVLISQKVLGFKDFRELAR